MAQPYYWCGSEESFEQVLKAQEKAEAMLATIPAGDRAGWIEEMIASLPPLWRHEGGTAVLEINGPVVQGEAGIARLWGVLGYADIAKAVNDAASHKDTKAMLYHINSPGGDVAGIVDMSQVLTQASAKFPSAVHTSNLMASAGYWMASAIKGEVSAGPTAIVGSIGVLRMHAEQSKALEQRGITVTVLRAGEFKAESNNVEPLTEGAKARAEAQLAEVHSLFRAQVAAGRPNLTGDKLMDVTQGQTFLGKSALKAGLVDRIGSFDQALKLLDNRKHPNQNPAQSKGTRAMYTLTKEQKDKIDAGELTLAAAIAENEAKAAADQAAADKAAADKAAADAAAAAAASAAQAPPTTAVDLLKSQLASAHAERDAARDELTALKVTTGAQSKAFDGLLAIARKEIGRMAIALGGTDAAAQTMDGEAAVAEHARITGVFNEKFPTSRRSKDEAGEEGQKAGELPLAFAVRLQTSN